MTRPPSPFPPSEAPDSPQGTKVDPRIGATPDLVVLREADLDSDLASAIERIRGDADPDRAQARILVVAREEDDTTESLATGIEIEPSARPAHTEPTNSVTGLAQRLNLSVDCLRRFLDESDMVIESLLRAPATHESKRHADTLREIHEWTREVVTEIATTVQDEFTGPVPVDLYELTRNAADQVTAKFQNIHLSQATDPTIDNQQAAQCFANGSALEAALRDALELVAQRIGGRGGVAVQLGRESATTVKIRILGLGEPGHRLAADKRNVFAERLEELRKRFAREFGGWLWHDILGPGGTGLVVHLPAARH